jgi:hypothetical protein
MIGKNVDPLLTKVEAAIKAKVPANLQNAFQRIITAGMQVMYSPQTQKLMQRQMNQQGNPADVAGDGVAKLLGILYKQSKNTLPIKAGIPAAQILLCEALDFMEKAGKIKITNDLIAQATKSMLGAILQMFGVTPQKLQAMAQAKQTGQQPAQASAQPAPAMPPAALPQGGIINSAMGAQ